MGMHRDAGSCEIDIIKEMAEGLGSTGLKLEDILEKTRAAGAVALTFVARYRDAGPSGNRPALDEVNASIQAYNQLVGEAEDVLRWLLIQREACGFRTHRNVNTHYPIPSRMKLLT
jgi:hypothetical protein